MIKFFRKIQQTLSSENKFAKYLIDAIGEITLVKIATWLPLKINDNKETHKENTIEEENSLKFMRNGIS